MNDFFDTNGYLLIENALDAARCRHLAAICTEHFRDRVAERQHSCEVIPWDPIADGQQEFTGLLDLPALVAATTDCLGPGYHQGNSLVMSSPPGGCGQAWHQDCPVDDASRFNCNRLFYLDDINEAMGPVVIVPGSHKRGRITPGDEQEDLPGQLVLTPRRGSLILLHGFTWHRVLPNHSRVARLSVNFRAFPAGCPRDYDHIGLYRNATVDFTAQ